MPGHTNLRYLLVSTAQGSAFGGDKDSSFATAGFAGISVAQEVQEIASTLAQKASGNTVLLPEDCPQQMTSGHPCSDLLGFSTCIRKHPLAIQAERNRCWILQY